MFIRSHPLLWPKVRRDLGVVFSSTETILSFAFAQTIISMTEEIVSIPNTLVGVTEMIVLMPKTTVCVIYTIIPITITIVSVI